MLFLRLTLIKRLYKCLSLYINIIATSIFYDIYNSLILFSHKEFLQLSTYILFCCSTKSVFSQQNLVFSIQNLAFVLPSFQKLLLKRMLVFSHKMVFIETKAALLFVTMQEHARASSATM